MAVFKNRLALHQLDLLQLQDMVGPLLGAKAIGPGNLIVYIGTKNRAREFARLKDNNGSIVEVGEEQE